MNLIFIFVEGIDDMRFINNIISPYFLNKNQIDIRAIPFQQKNNKIIKKDIKKFISHDYNFIFLSDLDSHSFPCITSRKEKRHDEYDPLPLENIIIVKEEIESWYIAGIDYTKNELKSINFQDSTENITKEDFNRIMKINNFDSRIDFIKEILKGYNLDLAIQRNDSLKYFINKLNILCS